MLETPCCVAIYAGQSFMRPFFNVVNYAGQSFFVALLWPFCGPFPVVPRCGQFCWPMICAALFRSCGLFFSERLNDSREPAKLCLLGHIYFAYSQDAVHNHLHTKIYTTFQLSSSAAYCIWAPRLLGTLHPTQTGAEC